MLIQQQERWEEGKLEVSQKHTSTYPRIPELMSPAGKPIAMMFSVM
jgi:hypothetical protein